MAKPKIYFCKECHFEIKERHLEKCKIPGHSKVYECPNCGHPHTIDEFWVEEDVEQPKSKTGKCNICDRPSDIETCYECLDDDWIFNGGL